MITASVLDYLGKFEGGIVTSISLMYNDNFYNAIFYYTENKMIINIDDNLKQQIGEIEETEHYVSLMQSIINMVAPYETIIDELKDIEDYYNSIFQSEDSEKNDDDFDEEDVYEEDEDDEFEDETDDNTQNDSYEKDGESSQI